MCMVGCLSAITSSYIHSAYRRWYWTRREHCTALCCDVVVFRSPCPSCRSFFRLTSREHSKECAMRGDQQRARRRRKVNDFVGQFIIKEFVNFFLNSLSALSLGWMWVIFFTLLFFFCSVRAALSSSWVSSRLVSTLFGLCIFNFHRFTTKTIRLRLPFFSARWEWVGEWERETNETRHGRWKFSFSTLKVRRDEFSHRYIYARIA